MSLTFKLASLVIRTAAKPIGNYLKRQAQQHDGFRRFAVRQAQRLHRLDMRMRLGILHDTAAQERMFERERRKESERKKAAGAATVRTEEEQSKANEEAEQQREDGKRSKAERETAKVKIRPLSEAKAIELGANFFSEAFIFAVAAGLLVWDSWRSRRKESARRDDVKERIDGLEEDVRQLKLKGEPDLAQLHEREEREREQRRKARSYGWYNPVGWWERTTAADVDDGSSDTNTTRPLGSEQPTKAVKEKDSAEANGEVKKAPDRIDSAQASMKGG